MNHSFDIDIARKYGVNCAIILQHIWFWVEKNKANRQNFHDGKYWTFNSVKAFQELFPYMTQKQIRTALDTLKQEGLILSGDYNDAACDRTKWYALSEKGKSILHRGQTDLPYRANAFAPQGKPIPDINTDINTDIKEIDKEKRHRYGEYKNVLLSDADMEKLKAEFPDWEERIERLSEYIETSGKSYKSHLAVIRAWARKETPKRSRGYGEGFKTI